MSLQRRAVTIERDTFSLGNMVSLIPWKMSFPMIYNMFRPFFATILSQSHWLICKRRILLYLAKIKKRLQHRCFLVNFAKYFEITFFTEHLLTTASALEWCFRTKTLHAFFYKQRFLSTQSQCCRSSHQKCSLRKGVLRNIAKFTGKHLCQRL